MKVFMGLLTVTLLVVWTAEVEACGRRRRRCRSYCPTRYVCPTPGYWPAMAPTYMTPTYMTPAYAAPAAAAGGYDGSRSPESYDPGPNPDRDGSVRYQK